MATKSKTPKRKKSKGVSSNSPKRKSPRKKGLFDNVMSGANLKTAAMNVALGGAGGAASTVGTKLTNQLTKGSMIANILVGMGVGFLASSFGAPKIGIGYAGGATALALSGGLKDNAEFVDDNALEAGEVYQTESGEFVKVLNDGTMEYLSDDEVQALSDENVIYPQYGTMNAMQQ